MTQQMEKMNLVHLELQAEIAGRKLEMENERERQKEETEKVGDPERGNGWT